MLGMANARSNHRSDRGLPVPRTVLIKLVWCAQALGWTRKRTLRHLLKFEAATRYGRHWYVSRGQLRRAFPEVWAEVAAEASEAATEAGDDDDLGHG